VFLWRDIVGVGRIEKDELPVARFEFHEIERAFLQVVL